MASIESGGSWQKVPKFPLSNILQHDEKESVGPNNVRNYWRSPDSDPVFVLNLGCNQTYRAVQLVNGRNRGTGGTRKFRYIINSSLQKTKKKLFQGCIPVSARKDHGLKYWRRSWKTQGGSRICPCKLSILTRRQLDNS